jgi:hypothetical protein
MVNPDEETSVRGAKWYILAVLLFVLTYGCASVGTIRQVPPNPVYREMIREWQMRIQQEGWSENMLHSILFQFRRIATYRTEVLDHWDTPNEFIQRGFSGDCEDIAIFMMGNLKRLGYPYEIRIAIVKAVLVDHAMLRIKMPDGRWILYDVVPPSVPIRRPLLFRPIVEFDDKHVTWFSSGEWEHYRLSKAN